MLPATIQTHGFEMSRLVPGLMRMNDWDRTTEELVGWIEACLDMGLTTFDHADIYGGYTCEAIFGKALIARPSLREKLQLVTKCDIMLISENRPNNLIKHYDTSKNHIVKSVEMSLRNFNTDNIDLLLIHRPDALMDADEVAEAFDELKTAGKVKFFGVSNFSPIQFDLLQSRLSDPLVTNQVEFHVIQLDPLHDGTFDHAQQHRYAPMAWSTLAGGAIFAAQTERAQRIRRVLETVGEEMDGASIDQVMLAWILRHPAQVVPVLGTGKLERLQSAVGALKYSMSRQNWYKIWEVSTGHEVP